LPTVIRTQDELAKLAGVSRYTVNRALRGLDDVGETTRKRILDLAEERGYRVNAAANAMVKGRFNGVALLESRRAHRSSSFGDRLYDGIHQALAERDVHLTLTRVSDDQIGGANGGNNLPKFLRQLMVDGVLINYFCEVPQPLIDLMQRFSLPSVWINRKQRHNCVYPDDYGGARLATEWLIEQGHRRIAFLAYSGWLHYSLDDRRQGYHDTMLAAGLEPDAVVERQPLNRTAFHARQWLDSGDAPTAVICQGLKEASAVSNAAAWLRRDIPGDLTLVGFHSSDLQNSLGHLAVTMVIPFQEVGRRAASRLLNLCDGKSDPGAEAVPYQMSGQIDGAPASSV